VTAISAQGGSMARKDEVELLLSGDDDEIVEIGPDGQIYRYGTSPKALKGKPIAGISDQKGEYGLTW